MLHCTIRVAWSYNRARVLMIEDEEEDYHDNNDDDHNDIPRGRQPSHQRRQLFTSGERCAHYLPDGLTCTSGNGRGHLDQCNSNNNGVKEAGKLKLNIMMATLAHRTGIAPHINITYYGEATGWPPTDRPHPPPRIVELLRRRRGRGQTCCRPYMMLSSNNSANLIAMIVRRIPLVSYFLTIQQREKIMRVREVNATIILIRIYGLRHDGDNGKTMAMTWQSTYLAFTFKTTINQRIWNILQLLVSGMRGEYEGKSEGCNNTLNLIYILIWPRHDDDDDDSNKAWQWHDNLSTLTSHLEYNTTINSTFHSRIYSRTVYITRMRRGPPFVDVCASLRSASAQ